MAWEIKQYRVYDIMKVSIDVCLEMCFEIVVYLLLIA